MDLNSALALSFATAIIGISPGPAVFATIAHTLSLKLKKTYLFITGIILGDLFFALIAMSGLALIASKTPQIFIALKIIGGGYLIYLGYKSWKSSKTIDTKNTKTYKSWKLISSGFLLTASNPKDLLFFVGFLPAFMDLENGTFSDFLIASIIITITFFITLSFYALSVNKAANLLSNKKTVTKLNKASAIILVCVGIFVIFT